MRRYRFLAEALVELQDATLYYLEEADYDPVPAERFEVELRRTIGEIRESPERWPRVDGSPDLRRCLLGRPFQDWAVLYHVAEDEVVIVALAHGRRRPGYWRDR